MINLIEAKRVALLIITGKEEFPMCNITEADAITKSVNSIVLDMYDEGKVQLTQSQLERLQ